MGASLEGCFDVFSRPVCSAVYWAPMVGVVLEERCCWVLKGVISGEHKGKLILTYCLLEGGFLGDGFVIVERYPYGRYLFFS